METTDEERTVRSLKDGDIFAEKYDFSQLVHVIERGLFDSYCLEAKPIIGKRLVRLAKGVLTNADIVLKFYDKPELYKKAVTFYGILSKSDYVCKCVCISMRCSPKRAFVTRPLQKIKAHEGFPDCLAFHKGFHTLDEWVRIPELSFVSRREALNLVRSASCRVRR